MLKRCIPGCKQLYSDYIVINLVKLKKTCIFCSLDCKLFMM